MAKITKITAARLAILLFLSHQAAAEEQKPPNIKRFEIPTFTGKPVDWNHQKPAINPLPKINGDAIFKVVNRCYPLKSGFGLDISLKTGATYKDTASSNQINTLDSNKYYAGIVANMPLYSDVEIDKDRKLEYQRRMQTTDTIKALLTGVATKRRAERLMGLYEALEKRAQERIKNGLAETAEQISFLEKVATTQGELDQANASAKGSAKENQSMIWQNHILIGAALAAVIDPLLVPVGVIGATAPDWMEWIIKPFYPVKHRGATHVALYWIAAIVLFILIDYHRIGLAFAIGGFSHVFADSFTIAGVPFAPWSESRFTLFGGKLRTGNGGEYVVAGIIAALCFCFVMYSPVKIGTAADKENGFIPFFYNWKKFYDEGLIDGAEWKKNRFNFF